MRTSISELARFLFQIIFTLQPIVIDFFVDPLIRT